MAHPPGEGGGRDRSPSLAVVAARWGRIGCIGFGGPPAHITLLRKLCVDDNRWISDRGFEDAIAACNLLPGPASTQLAIFCAWQVAGALGAIVGGLAFILPGLALILALSAAVPRDIATDVGARSRSRSGSGGRGRGPTSGL